MEEKNNSHGVTEVTNPVDVDVCIIGAGPSGITLALELGDAGLTVALAEAGGDAPIGNGHDTYKGTVRSGTEHPDIDLFRERCFGGSSWLWPGRCVPYDEIDFQSRSYVENGGWPLRYEDLIDDYVRAHAYCDLGRFTYDAGTVIRDQPAELFHGIADSPIQTSKLERWSNNWNFGTVYFERIMRHPNIRLLLGTSCTHLQTLDGGQQIQWVETWSDKHRKRQVRAKYYVLAAGGLENARLLLASNDICPGGIGNDHDQVGRYYAKHNQGIYASVQFSDPVFARHLFRYVRDIDGIFVRRRLSLTPAAQRRHGILNFSAFLRQPVSADPSHGSALLTLRRYLADAGLFRDRSDYQRRIENSDRNLLNGASGSHFGNIIAGLPQLPTMLYDQAIRSRGPGRSLPSADFLNDRNLYRLHYYLEQEPIANSRICLSNDRDMLGLPRLIVDYQATDLDRRTVEHAHDLLDQTLRRAGKGRLIYEKKARDALAPSPFECIGGHFMGTTRMSKDPSTGVVDKNCRVFGVDNLYVAGSSVFATTSHANPTLTLIALAIRAADHIKKSHSR